jgi:cellulose synthase/poly-beta-1,6-N-acetylglucosamine synthase-like glycosyltransferase
MSVAIDGVTGTAFLPWLGWWGTAAALAVRAALPSDRRTPPAALRLDVVVPAHDEEAVIVDLVESLRAQEGPAQLGRVLVVADHCSDRTAELARAAGAEVLERDGIDAGKPPSLREGIALLAGRADRGDAVVLLDADCVVDPGFLSAVSGTLATGAEVVQAAYTIRDDDEGAVRASLRRAFGLRNVVRASGGERLGLPCLLFGSGIVLRWDVVPALSFADPRIAGTGDSRPVGDDTLMTLELLRAGHKARFCGDASVLAAAPPHEGDLGAQRLRWEAGQIMTWKLAARAVPELLRAGDLKALVALADWMNPPLAPSVVIFGATSVAAVVLVAAGAASPPVLVLPVASAAALATYLGVGVTVLEGWRSAVELFAGAPKFLAWKTGVYLHHRESRRTSTEVRTTS